MNKNKNKVRLGIIIAICLLVIGTSFAFWILHLSQTGVNTLAASCFEVSISKETSAINLQRSYPLLDEEGMELTPYQFTITNHCDSFASYTIHLELMDSVAEDSRLDPQYIKVMIDEKTPAILNIHTTSTPTLENAYVSYELSTGYLDANENAVHSLRLWLDEDVTMDDPVSNRSIDARITVTATYVDHYPAGYEQCIEEYGEDSIQCSIIASASTEVEGACPSISQDGTVTVTGAESENGYVCEAKDDYGTSYYYRGNVTNNYVKFAGFYWRIIRINGNGSIRLIYAGDASVIDALDEETKKEVLANGYQDTSGYTRISNSAYNGRWKNDNVQTEVVSNVYNDNAGIGFMYGNRDGIVEGTTRPGSIFPSVTTTYYYADSYTYDDASDRFVLTDPVGYTGAEVTSDFVGKYTCASTDVAGTCQLLRKIESVVVSNGANNATLSYSLISYGTTSSEKAQQNINDSTVKDILDTWYENHLLYTEYETYLSDTLFCNDRSFRKNSTPLGYGGESSSYRWNNGPWDNTNSQYPMLSCGQQNDRFTVNDAMTGNAALTYPIGLITADEVVLAGAYNTENTNYYLYTGYNYWTMSPTDFYYMDARVRNVTASGSLSSCRAIDGLGVRPIINLKSDSLKSGQGTVENPYLV